VATVYLGLGSNIGDRLDILRAALRELRLLGEVSAVSSIYETAPWGDTDQPAFLNVCCVLHTDLSPEALLHRTIAIEQRLGRRPGRRWGPRLIDIDLLTYDDLQQNTAELTLPHPRLTQRAFVLVPLTELAPQLRIPGHVDCVRDLLGQLQDTGQPPRLVVSAADVLTREARIARAGSRAAGPREN
jgi:2-amino-4-hydroxy-6-hydroxymethyldihydropteridine diphosphokinase